MACAMCLLSFRLLRPQRAKKSKRHNRSLALLALFTHNNIFWIAALLIAAFRMPDFLSPLQSMAASLGAILNRLPPEEKPAQAPAAEQEAPRDV